MFSGQAERKRKSNNEEK
jgi:hypothetical protein